MINDNEIAGKDQSVVPILQTLLIIITVSSTLTKLTKIFTKALRSLATSFAEGRVLMETIKLQPLDVPIR